MIKKKLFTKTLVTASIVVLTLTAVFFTYVFIPSSKTKPFVQNNYIFDLEYSKELSGISVMSQETSFTCHIVALAIVKKYFGFEATESGLRNDLNILNRRTGMLPKENLLYAKRIFEPLGYNVSNKNLSSQTEILNTISISLENDLPAIILYSAVDDFNKPHWNTHYAVVYGIDMRSKTVKISNPYGRLETLSFQDLYDGLDFTSYSSMPFSFRLAGKFGMVGKNNIITFEPQE